MRLCVFCGSRFGREPFYGDVAREIGRLCAEAGVGVVYGGGRVGLMGATADAALAAGGEAIGVIPRALAEREVGHDGLNELRLVDSMHERKAEMAALSDGFLALPGGAGTLEEIFEQWTWAQLGIHDKPVIFLNARGFYDPIEAMLKRILADGFIAAEHASLVRFAASPATALELFQSLAAERRADAASSGGWGGKHAGRAVVEP